MDNVDGLIRAAIITFLQRQEGAAFTLNGICSRAKVSLATARKMMVTLEDQKVVRRVTGEAHAKFYIPTAAQLAAMEKALAPARAWPVLKPRPQLAERIAAIRAAREAIPSLY